MLRCFTRLAIAAYLVIGLLSGQTEIGGAALNGTVTDATGAAVPNAKVTATNSGTGTTRTTQTNDAGLYNFSRLPVGNYDITVEAQGFKTTKRSGLGLTV